MIIVKCDICDNNVEPYRYKLNIDNLSTKPSKNILKLDICHSCKHKIDQYITELIDESRV